MRTERILSIVLAMVLLASAVSLAITPAAADLYYEIPGDANPHDDKLTKDELTSAILPYMLDKGDFTLDDIGDAAYVYTNWNGEPKTITTTSKFGDFQVTFYRPPERVASAFARTNRQIVAIGACDKLVGIRHVCILPEERKACGGKILEIPDANYNNPEVTACLRPDLVLGYIPGSVEIYQKKVNALVMYEGPGVTAPYAEVYSEQMYSDIRHFGEAVDMREEAEELNSFIKEKLDKVFDVISKIPDEEKPKVCLVSGKGKVSTPKSGFCSPFDEAGGISIKKDLGVSKISVEALIKWNPNFLFITNSGPRYYYSDEEEGFKSNPLSLTVEQVLEDPRLQTINAVKNGSVYYITGCCASRPDQRLIVGTLYLAKIFYPDEFKDLDLEKEGNEVFERFYGDDGLYTEFADNLSYLREFIEEGKELRVAETR